MTSSTSKYDVINKQIWRNHALGKHKCINVLLNILTLLKPYTWYKQPWMTSKWTKIFTCAYPSLWIWIRINCPIWRHERRICVDSSICVEVRSKYATCKGHKCLLSDANLLRAFMELQPPQWEDQRPLVTAAVPQHRWSPAARACSFSSPSTLSNDVTTFSMFSRNESFPFFDKWTPSSWNNVGSLLSNWVCLIKLPP